MGTRTIGRRGGALGAAIAALLAALAVGPVGEPTIASAGGEGGMVAVSADSVAREWGKEFTELKKKEGTKAADRRLAILRDMERAMSGTAREFLVGVVKKPSSTGDERVAAIATLGKIADAQNPQFDTIYFLTDGNPTAGKYWTSDGLRACVRSWARYRRTVIHTIGLSLADQDRGMPNLAEDLQAMAGLLRSLAESSSGEFREILRAPSTPQAPKK